MKSLTILLAGSSALMVAALSPADFFPTCAISCFSDAIKKTSCGAADYACQCQTDNQAVISNAATSCVLAACGLDVALSTHYAPFLPLSTAPI